MYFLEERVIIAILDSWQFKSTQELNADNRVNGTVIAVLSDPKATWTSPWK
jgi:hypothetical protein